MDVEIQSLRQRMSIFTDCRYFLTRHTEWCKTLETYIGSEAVFGGEWGGRVSGGGEEACLVHN